MVFSKKDKLTEIIDKARGLFSEERLETVSKIINKYPINFTGLDINYNRSFETQEKTKKEPEKPLLKYSPGPKYASFQTRVPLSNDNISLLSNAKVAFQKYRPNYNIHEYI